MKERLNLTKKDRDVTARQVPDKDTVMHEQHFLFILAHYYVKINLYNYFPVHRCPYCSSSSTVQQFIT